MKRALVGLAATTLLVVSGCSLPVAAKPLARSVDLVLEDAREDRFDEREGYAGFMATGALAAVPLLPFLTIDAEHYLDRSLAPEIRAAIGETRLFGEVLGPGDLTEARAAAAWELRVTLIHTARGRRRTFYGLLFPGVIFHLVGAPFDWTFATVELRIEAIARDGSSGAALVGEGGDTDVGFEWIYEDGDAEEREERLHEALRTALAEALEPLFTR